MRSMYNKRYSLIIHLKKDYYAISGSVKSAKNCASSNSKFKRKGDHLKLDLKPTTDIAAAVGKIKKHEQFLVGFALETNNEEANAKEKMERKNFDFIVLNSLQDPNSGFGFDTNKVSIIHRSGLQKQYELKSKLDVAEDIVNEINTLIF